MTSFRFHARYIIVAALALACASAFAGFPITNLIPPDILAALAVAGAGGMPFMIGDTEATLKEIAETIEKQGKAWDAWKETNDARIKALEKGLPTSDFEAKLAKIEKDVVAGEAISAKLTAAELEAKAAKAKAEETEKALGELEGEFEKFKLGASKQNDPRAQMKAWDGWARAVVDAHVKGVVNLTADQQKLLSDVAAEAKTMGVANDTTGGYLAPTEMTMEILKNVLEVSPVRSMVRVRSTANRSIQIPKRTGTFAAVWVAEQGTRAETDGLRYGMLEIPTHELYALVDVTEQNLEDSAYNLASEIQMEATEQFALAEGTAVVLGTGVGKPEGFMVNADVATVNSGAAAALTADGILRLKASLKTAYVRNASFALNRTSMGAVRRLKDGAGNYLWVPGIAQGRPNTLDGDPYVEVPDMADIAAGTKPIAYGDFNRAYTLVDRIAMAMLRDPLTQATSGVIRFIFRRRLGGMVVLPEAIKTQTVAA